MPLLLLLSAHPMARANVSVVEQLEGLEEFYDAMIALPRNREGGRRNFTFKYLGSLGENEEIVVKVHPKKAFEVVKEDRVTFHISLVDADLVARYGDVSVYASRQSKVYLDRIGDSDCRLGVTFFSAQGEKIELERFAAISANWKPKEAIIDVSQDKDIIFFYRAKGYEHVEVNVWADLVYPDGSTLRTAYARLGYCPLESTVTKPSSSEAAPRSARGRNEVHFGPMTGVGVFTAEEESVLSVRIGLPFLMSVDTMHLRLAPVLGFNSERRGLSLSAFVGQTLLGFYLDSRVGLRLGMEGGMGWRDNRRREGFRINGIGEVFFPLSYSGRIGVPEISGSIGLGSIDNRFFHEFHVMFNWYGIRAN